MEHQVIPIKDFLLSVPPGKTETVAINTIRSSGERFGTWIFNRLRLWTVHPRCNEYEWYVCNTEIRTRYGLEEPPKLFTLTYRCVSFLSIEKIYVISVQEEVQFEKSDKGPDFDRLFRMTKVGELPAFGPGVPKRLKKAAGGDLPLLRKADKCLSQGMGIGAFSYYRRVVENRKNELFSQLITAINTIAPGATELLDELAEAKKRKRFTDSVDAIKSGLPESLLINGDSPITLLHNALSVGLHSLTEDQCLEAANEVRLVLTHMLERVGQLATDDQEVKKAALALRNIANKKSEKN